MPFGAKLRKLYNHQFYLSAEDFELLIQKCEHEAYKVRDAINFIDAWGSWLDG